MIASTAIVSFAHEEPLAEADCSFGIHRMLRVGGAVIRDTNGNIRYNNDWAAFKCTKCNAYFACEGDPVFWSSIGNYFHNPPLTDAVGSVYTFRTDAPVSYKERPPLPGFEFVSNYKSMKSIVDEGKNMSYAFEY